MQPTPDLALVPAWIQVSAAIIGFIIVSSVVAYAWLRKLKPTEQAAPEVQFHGAAIVDSRVTKELLDEIRQLNRNLQQQAQDRRIQMQVESAVDDAVEERMRVALENLERSKQRPRSTRQD